MEILERSTITYRILHFIGEDDLVVHRMTMIGTHRASTMPLPSGLRVSGSPVAWTYINIWKLAAGQVIEHWACPDDVGLLRQVGGCLTPSNRLSDSRPAES
jgi:predicted ester cyclase